jgi:hypothetical protein
MYYEGTIYDLTKLNIEINYVQFPATKSDWCEECRGFGSSYPVYVKKLNQTFNLCHACVDYAIYPEQLPIK